MTTMQGQNSIMTLLDKASLRLKLGALAALCTLALAALGGWLAWKQYETAYDGRRVGLKQSVETAKTVLVWAHGLEQSGAATREQAQAMALQVLRQARYSGNEYFWINDMRPHVVMHPIKPELDGKDVSNTKDPQGKALFVAFVEEVRRKGSGYVDYLWPKPGEQAPVAKVSYVAGFQPWGWVLGTGMYMDDLRAAFLASLRTLALTIAAVVALVLVVMQLIYRSIARGLAQATAAAAAVADGALDVAIPSGLGSEMGLLLGAMARMQAALASTVRLVRGNAEGVATASVEIAQGNLDLSQRTEQQASALEETAAAMEELGTTVKQNAENARQANQLALSASSVAIKGGEVVGQVVDTMKGINDSSKRIANIIAVIDGIAFQTNILALNAAVEAARAGEQGRGFAVVAGEVRSLAQRSADAAREIKVLISASVDRVDQGTALVDQAGVTMQEIVASIKRVTDIMGEISAASNEQSQGVNQVGEAVAQMDQATQQNAALVEQSAAAAEGLRNQAQQLVQAVAVFKLDDQGRSTPAQARPAADSGQARSDNERRGHNRAKNVARLQFKAMPKPSAAIKSEEMTRPKSKTGTDDWESF